MSLPSFSVRRPIFTVMITLIVLTLGGVSMSRVPIDMLPEIEMPQLTIRTSYEGADPEVMERLVTQTIEEIVSTVPGVEELSSISAEGASTVKVTFAYGTDIDVIAQDVRSVLEDELDELPDEVTRPQIRKFDISSFPVVVLGVGSPLDPIELTELIEEQIRYRFARIPGVAQVDIFGGYDREVRVELDPAKVRALEIPLNSVLDAIKDTNLDVPAGSIEQGRYDVRLRVPAEFMSIDEVRQTVIAVRNGAPITLADIGTVEDTYQKLTRIVRIDGLQGIRIGIRKQPAANTVEVAERILAEINQVNADFPQVHIAAVLNQGNFIERSISNVANSVVYGGLLAFLVLLFFLRSIRSAGVISVAIPVSLIATFALLQFAGLSLNLMTLGGLALGVGMMVDSSIVVLENIVRRRDENGETIPVAAITGAKEVAGAIVASTITTVIIFLPLMFVRGVTGLLFRELAYVVSFSLACSLLVALTIVPMLASRLLVAPDATGSDLGWVARLARGATAQMDQLANAYRRFLLRALGHKTVTVAIAVAATALSFLLYPLVGTEFMPPADEGEVRISGELEPGTRIGLVDRQTKLIEDIVVQAVPEARAIVANVGANYFRPDASALGEVQVSLSPAQDRSRSNQEIANDLRRRLSGKIPGMEVRTRAPQGQFILERVLGNSDEGITVEIRGFELDVLDQLAQQAATRIATVRGITDVQLSRKAGVPQAVLRIDRDKAAYLGLSVKDVAQVIEVAVAGRRAGEYRAKGLSYRILVQLKDVDTLELDEVLALTVRTPSGETVALRNVVTVENSRGPVLIDRKDQQRIVKVNANTAGRDEGSIAADVEELLAEIPRPVGYDINVAGNREQQQKAFDELSMSLLLALLLVYMVMACQYESLRDPLVVMMSVPVAATGVLATLWLTRTTLNIQSFIGCIMLGGIVVNNAILLVDQANQLLARGGASAIEAVVEAGRRRLRPILMTTTTTVLGLLPLALGIGEGAEAQAPLARAVTGGLVMSTLITLVLIPVVFVLVHGDRSTRGAAETAGPDTRSS